MRLTPVVKHASVEFLEKLDDAAGYSYLLNGDRRSSGDFKHGSGAEAAPDEKTPGAYSRDFLHDAAGRIEKISVYREAHEKGVDGVAAPDQHPFART